MSLSVEYKAFWMYLCDRCDHGGIWKVNIPLTNLLVGAEINEEKALELFGNERIEVLENGDWHIRRFVSFQYGNTLNQKSSVHRGVMKLFHDKGLQRLIKGLGNPLVSIKAKDKAKDKDKEGGDARGGRVSFQKPAPDEVTAYAKEIGFDLDGEKFVDHYAARGWKYKGGVAMKDWRAAVRTWKKNDGGFRGSNSQNIGQNGDKIVGHARPVEGKYAHRFTKPD